MIDPEWFARAAMMAGAPLPEAQVKQLAKELGDERELLPHLLLSQTAFADWHLARSAIRAAVMTVIRPRTIPANARSAGIEKLRCECTEAILQSMREEGLDALNYLSHLRGSVGGRLQPNDFIE